MHATEEPSRGSFVSHKGSVRKNAPTVILYILHSGNLYGTERMALATLAGMPEYAARVIVAPPPHGTASVTVAAREAGFETVSFRTRWELLRGLLPYFFRYRSIDVIGTGASQSFTCYVLGKLLCVRLRQLQVCHGGTMEAHAYGRKRHLGSIPIRIVAVSQYVRQKLLEYGVREDSISVIDNFLPAAQTAKATRAPYAGGNESRQVDTTRVKVIVVSRVDSIKRIDLLIAAVETGELDDFQFDVYGTGTDLEMLRSRAAGLGNVTLNGFSPEIAEHMRESDFLLHLCPIEPFGLVILEAFACNLCVVVPNRGGASNLVEDGSNGLRFAADDLGDLIRALQQARSLPTSVLQGYVDAGRSRLEHDYSETVSLDRYRSALQSAH